MQMSGFHKIGNELKRNVELAFRPKLVQLMPRIDWVQHSTFGKYLQKKKIHTHFTPKGQVKIGHYVVYGKKCGNVSVDFNYFLNHRVL